MREQGAEAQELDLCGFINKRKKGQSPFQSLDTVPAECRIQEEGKGRLVKPGVSKL